MVANYKNMIYPEPDQKDQKILKFILVPALDLDLVKVYFTLRTTNLNKRKQH